jgi:hypothetical protein
MIKFEPSAGSHIQHACEEAVSLANVGDDSVSFRFNDVDMIVAPGETAESAVTRWTAQFETNAEAYRNSPEGKAAKVEAERRRRQCQRDTDVLIARLPNVTNDLPALVRWCVALSQTADHIGITWDKSAVADTIEAAGWTRNAHVGKPDEAFKDKVVMGEYLVGQALDCLRIGMPPHPVIEKFAKSGGFLS